MKARQESCDRVTPNIFRKDHRSLFLDPLYGDEEFGRDMAVTRETSSFDVGANCMLSPLIQEDQEVKYLRKANRHFYCWSRRLAHAHFDLNKHCGFCELPDSASSALHASSSHDSDDFDHGAYLDRHDQHDQLFQTSSSDSTQSWSQMPNQS